MRILARAPLTRLPFARLSRKDGPSGGSRQWIGHRVGWIVKTLRMAYVFTHGKDKKIGRDWKTGAFVTVEKTLSGQEKWRVDGKVHFTSSSTASVMDKSVEKYRTTLERLAKR